MADNVELMRKWLDVFPEGEFDAFPGEIAPDFVFHLPFPPPGVPSEFRGRETVRDVLSKTSAGRSRLVMSNIEIHQTDDPELLVATARGEATMANGNLYRNSYVLFTRIRDGVVLEHTEYLNPLLVIEAADG
ncbi:MAG: nuclear transport factor 2 family protein [Novosphingobium sp.]